MASAWAPPTAETSRMPRNAQAASTAGCGRPPWAGCGGGGTGGAPTRLGDGFGYRGIQGGERLVERCLRDPGGFQVHVVEAGGVLADGLRAAAPDVVADGADLGRGGLDVGGRPGQDAGQGGPAELARFAPAQVDTGNHPPSLRRVPTWRL